MCADLPGRWKAAPRGKWLVGVGWAMMQKHKSLEIKAPVLQKDTDKSPEPCLLGPLSLPSVCFCRTEGRGDHQHVLGYCTNIIGNWGKNMQLPCSVWGVYTLFFLFGGFFFWYFSFPNYCSWDAQKIQALFPSIPYEWAVCKSVFTSDRTLQRGCLRVTKRQSLSIFYINLRGKKFRFFWSQCILLLIQCLLCNNLWCIFPWCDSPTVPHLGSVHYLWEQELLPHCSVDMTLQRWCSSCWSLLIPEVHECITCFISLSVEILSTGSQPNCVHFKKRKGNWPNHFV